MGELGANAHGEILEAGRVPDCYLGLLLDHGDTEDADVLVVTPRRITASGCSQSDGTVLYELLTGTPTGCSVSSCSWRI